ncbi:hypothetical protein F4781DRAFT_397081 [Annulohypoxylon bovei var. microspora]|nr:hypothetical protein F4781DRAFT_397081 [Annulohypoxylon bovei var. microspora]
MIVRERLDDGGERKFVLKAAARGSDEDIKNEINRLKQLQFAAHVSNTIHLGDSPLVTLQVPYFLMEYLPHGSFRQFQERVTKANQILPNRMIWSIFLCRKN